MLSETKYAFDNFLEILNTLFIWRIIACFCLNFKIIIQSKDIFFKPKYEDAQNFLCFIYFCGVTISDDPPNIYLGKLVLIVDFFCMIKLWWRCWYVDGSEHLYTNILVNIGNSWYIMGFIFRDFWNSNRHSNTHRI